MDRDLLPMHFFNRDVIVIVLTEMLLCDKGTQIGLPTLPQSEWREKRNCDSVFTSSRRVCNLTNDCDCLRHVHGD